MDDNLRSVCGESKQKLKRFLLSHYLLAMWSTLVSNAQQKRTAVFANNKNRWLSANVGRPVDRHGDKAHRMGACDSGIYDVPRAICQTIYQAITIRGG